MKVEEDSMKNLSENFHKNITKKVQNIHKTNEKTINSIHSSEKKSNIRMPNSKHKPNPSLYFVRHENIHKSVESKRRISTLERSFEKNDNSKNPNQLKEARIKKELHLKKMLLLSQFEVEDQLRPAMIINSPTTEAMKNSIMAIKFDPKFFNSEVKAKYNKEHSSMLINAGSNTIKGKKACARDGCSGSMYQDKLVIFGGDRHLMAFHDLYFLNVKQIL